MLVAVLQKSEELLATDSLSLRAAAHTSIDDKNLSLAGITDHIIART